MRTDAEFAQRESRFDRTGRNYFLVGVEPLKAHDSPGAPRFDGDNEGFAVSYRLFFPAGVMERIGYGGGCGGAAFRNAKYAELEERGYRNEAARFCDGKGGPVIWTKRAERLRERRDGDYLPEEAWTPKQARGRLAGPELWHYWLLRGQYRMGSRRINALADRETATFILRTELGSGAEEAIVAARTTGLEALKAEHEQRITFSILNAIQELESRGARYGMSDFRREVHYVEQSTQLYQAACDALGMEPLALDVADELRAARERRTPNGRFAQAARALAGALDALGVRSCRRGRFFSMSADHTRASYIDHNDVKRVVAL